MTTKKMEQYDHPRPSPDLSGKRKYPVDSDAKRVMTVDAEQQLVRGQTAHPDMSLTERNVINIVDPKNNRRFIILTLLKKFFYIQTNQNNSSELT
ncbi:hypothetical protein PV328_002286 [Microctonus aethiopoides]|uniref:Uncharacterized protein n=1 Tax=Microctonus aethiopoides TaxID=144406 RepID=A0AA39FZ76_9HYME|nr:hypothetical protein PV328_002286 [Microctonus aethiopoides]